MKTDDNTYLRGLARRLFLIPVGYGVDQGDCDRLREMAKTLSADPCREVGALSKGDIWLSLVPRLTAEEKDALEQLAYNRKLLDSAKGKMHFRTLDEAADFARDHL